MKIKNKKFISTEKVQMLNSVHNELISLSRESILVENCGIIVGTNNNKRWNIIKFLENEEPEYQSRFSVTRNMRKIWGKLNLIARIYSPADYIGEFHTHTAGPLKPSPQDLRSMKKLLVSKEVSRPQILLLGIGIPNGEIAFWEISKLLIKKLTIEIL